MIDFMSQDNTDRTLAFNCGSHIDLHTVKQTSQGYWKKTHLDQFPRHPDCLTQEALHHSTIDSRGGFSVARHIQDIGSYSVVGHLVSRCEGTAMFLK